MAEHCATTRGAGNNRAFEDAANSRIQGELQGEIEQAGTELCQAQLKLASSLFCLQLAQPTELELD